MQAFADIVYLVGYGVLSLLMLILSQHQNVIRFLYKIIKKSFAGFDDMMQVFQNILILLILTADGIVKVNINEIY